MTIESTPPVDSSDSKLDTSPITGTTARPDCLAEALATRRQRSVDRFLQARADTATRADTKGTIAEAPSMVASRTTSSSWVPLSTATASVRCTDGSATGVRSCSRSIVTPDRTADVMRPNHSCPRPSNTTTTSPADKRSTCVKW